MGVDTTGANPRDPSDGEHVEVRPDEYCRALEAYLCRKNDGHLIRIVGPSFECVCGWAARGVPLAVACQGIDRYFDRYHAKPGRRRPVRIDFCEHDVLDAFDEWRRAVGLWGVTADGGGADAAPEDRQRHGSSLMGHLDRTIARLTARRADADRAFDAVLDEIVRELDVLRGGGRALRGAARAECLARLTELDARLLAGGRAQLTGEDLELAQREAEAELAVFRARLSPDAYAQALTACTDRVIRDRARLPVVTFE